MAELLLHMALLDGGGEAGAQRMSGAITGRKAATRLATGAVAPFVFSVERFGIDLSLTVSALLGAVGVAACVAVTAAAKRAVTATS